MTALPSPAPAVHRRHLDPGEIDAVHAAHIHRHHLAAVGLDAAREHFDAAVHAKLMADGVLVEEIFLQILLAGAELKALRGHKGEVQALLGADRAVAGGDHGKIAGAFEPHLATMASAGKGLAVGHRVLTTPRGPDDSAPSSDSQHSR